MDFITINSSGVIKVSKISWGIPALIFVYSNDIDLRK